ncbi:hypothetical protein MIR68_011663 [Amoeboaphelidium protococcarum]|nr:hypothetical protein MIR68_011663 [Amoeboaphelidium protococcarum]
MIRRTAQLQTRHLLNGGTSRQFSAAKSQGEMKNDKQVPALWQELNNKSNQQNNASSSSLPIQKSSYKAQKLTGQQQQPRAPLPHSTATQSSVNTTAKSPPIKGNQNQVANYYRNVISELKSIYHAKSAYYGDGLFNAKNQERSITWADYKNNQACNYKAKRMAAFLLGTGALISHPLTTFLGLKYAFLSGSLTMSGAKLLVDSILTYGVSPFVLKGLSYSSWLRSRLPMFLLDGNQKSVAESNLHAVEQAYGKERVYNVASAQQLLSIYNTVLLKNEQWQLMMNRLQAGNLQVSQMYQTVIHLLPYMMDRGLTFSNLSLSSRNYRSYARSVLQPGSKVSASDQSPDQDYITNMITDHDGVSSSVMKKSSPLSFVSRVRTHQAMTKVMDRQLAQAEIIYNLKYDENFKSGDRVYGFVNDSIYQEDLKYILNNLVGLQGSTVQDLIMVQQDVKAIDQLLFSYARFAHFLCDLRLKVRGSSSGVPVCDLKKSTAFDLRSALNEKLMDNRVKVKSPSAYENQFEKEHQDYFSYQDTDLPSVVDELSAQSSHQKVQQCHPDDLMLSAYVLAKTLIVCSSHLKTIQK